MNILNMNRWIVLSILVLSMVSCKNDKNSTDEVVEVQKMEPVTLPEGQQIFRGEFIFLEDAAVLTPSKEIYAVQIDEKMQELNEVAKALQQTEFDMVNVVIHGSVKTNPMRIATGEGWEQMVTITKIIEVTQATSANVISAGKKLDIKEVK